MLFIFVDIQIQCILALELMKEIMTVVYKSRNHEGIVYWLFALPANANGGFILG